MRMLFKVEQNKNITVKTLTPESQRLLNFKQDFIFVKQSANQSTILYVRVKEKILIASKKYLAIACWPCGKWHYAHYCRFQKHKCQTCHRCKHKKEFCSPQEIKLLTHERKPQIQCVKTFMKKAHRKSHIQIL